MNDLTAKGGDAPRTLDVVAALVADHALSDAQILILGRDESVISTARGRILRVLRTPHSPSAIHDLVDHALTSNPKTGSEIVLVGGDSATAEAIERAIPKLTMSSFFVHHVSDGGQVTTWPRRKGHMAAHALGTLHPLTEREERDLFARAASDEARAHDEHRQRAAFFQDMKTRRSPATVALLMAIAAMFLLQLSWSHDVMAALGLKGASQDWQQYWLVLAVAMGALYTPQVMQGELWRGISVGFLHFNLMHIAANSFVLWVLGSQLEKVLGTCRLVLIYTVALLGGSLASTFLTDGVAVGASGAIWGLLGAQVALAYGRPQVMPQSIARAMKPLAMRNLVLNVGISFIGGIDWAAHFGGGLAGGLLLASGVLYLGYKPGSDPARDSPALRMCALGCALLMVAGVVTALVMGQPWALAAAVHPS